MELELELFLKNIGKIREASVKLNGITVVAGQNDTGKSTIGKAIFALLHGCRKDNSLHTSAKNILQSALERELDDVFHGQVQNIYFDGDGKIELKLDDTTTSVHFRNGHISEIKHPIRWLTNIFYFDSPQALDHILLIRNRRRKKCKKLEHIYAILSKVCEGEIVAMDDMELGYQAEENGGITSLKNLSLGLKNFLIFKTLLQYGLIKNGSILLLDEPEKHLHPEWQLLYAELLVLLHKELESWILLNTHSHYFLDAIEVYSQKYGVADQCRFYLSSLNGKFATITDVTGNTEAIYQEFARPLQQLENERYRILSCAV